MFVKRMKAGDKIHFYLYESVRVEGKVKSRNLGKLGSTDQAVEKALVKLRDAGKITPEVCNRLSEPFNSDIWGTPDHLLELVRSVFDGVIGLDPCTQMENPTNALKFFTKQDDGLTQSWNSETVFMNPPYSAPLNVQFIKKLVEEFEDGNFQEAIILTKAGQFQNVGTGGYYDTATAKVWIKGRVKFKPLREGKKLASPNFDSGLAYWGYRPDVFLETFNSICTN